MEIKVSMVIAVVLSALVVVAHGLSLPSELQDNDVQLDSADEQELEEGRRATWLETRELKAAFKDMVLNALTELTEEGLVAPGVVNSSPEAEPKEKRGRWQGFCFKRTRSGRFLPYICWKGDRK